MVGALYRKEIEAKMEVERASSPELDPTDPSDANKIKVNIMILIFRDEDPDPVGSVDFWPSGTVTFTPDPTCDS